MEFNLGGVASAAQEEKIHKEAQMNNVARKPCEVKRGRNSFLHLKGRGRGRGLRNVDKII